MFISPERPTPVHWPLVAPSGLTWCRPVLLACRDSDGSLQESTCPARFVRMHNCLQKNIPETHPEDLYLHNFLII